MWTVDVSVVTPIVSLHIAEKSKKITSRTIESGDDFNVLIY